MNTRYVRAHSDRTPMFIMKINIQYGVLQRYVNVQIA